MAEGIIQKGQPFRVPLPKGVNLYEDEFAVDPRSDCVSVENVSLAFNGLRVRNGETAYINKGYQNLASGIRSMHRYRTSTGTKKVMVSSGLFIYADSDNGSFDLLGTMGPSAEGYVDFRQYRNSLGMFSEVQNPNWYNVAASPSIITPTLYPISFETTALLSVNNASSGGFLQDGTYLYRITFTIKQGGDFLGETAASARFFSTRLVYHYSEQVLAGGAGNEHKVNFLRPGNTEVDAIPAYVDQIYFYRSPKKSTAVVNNTYISTEDTDLYRIGSVSMATVRAAAPGTNIFTDDGSITLGPDTPQISHGVRWHPIRPRYTAFHKGRLWVTYCNVAPNASTAVYELDQDSVYCSRFVNNGTEPIVFQTATPKFEVDPYSGEGNTGLASWQGKTLLAFKPKCTKAFYGGDDSLSATIPNIQGEILSPTIGCIAPATIVQAEGAVMWVSHRGPEIFDGGQIMPLNAEKIKPLFDLIPAARRRKMTAYYDSRDREYVIFWTSLQELIANRRSMRYSFLTREWTLDKYPRGIGAVLEVNDSDSTRRLLYGLDDQTTFFDTPSNDPIIVYGKNQYHDGTADEAAIPWTVSFPWHHGGDGTLDKTLHEVSVEGSWVDTMQVAFKATGPQGIIDTTATPIPLLPLPGGRGARKMPVAGLQIQGKRIQVILSGTTLTGETNITGVYLHFGGSIGHA